MTRKKNAKDILNIPPNEEQGGEAIYGFDYQAHCTARLCLEMMHSHDITEIVCEHHEDLIQIKDGNAPNFCSVKKRESVKTWTIALLKDAIKKLFEKLQYKNVGELIIYGSGRPSSDGECSLAGLIALLDRPDSERDSNWDHDLKQYEDYFTAEFGPEIDPSTVQKGLRLLKIDLSMPNPEAIEDKNVRLAVDVISGVWGVEVPLHIADRAYNNLYKKVWDASKNPKMPRTKKRILRREATSSIKDILHDGTPLAEKQQDILDILTKLQKGGLEAHVIYALQMRMNARQVKFELELQATDWQDLKTDIAVEWENFCASHTGLMGAVLWKELRELLKNMGHRWVAERHNNLFASDFGEGVFFDMMAVCEAHIGV